MRRAEVFARTLVAVVFIGAIGLPLLMWWQTPLVHAQMAENGGWSPDTLRATVGAPLRLRFTSDDVVHGFAVGKLDFPAIDILPGKITEATLLFSHPGTYTFYCTRWCGLNHWRMRGTIEVDGGVDDTPSAGGQGGPLYVELNLDLDATRTSPVLPRVKPVASVPAQQLLLHLNRYPSVDYYRGHAPYEAWQDLRAEPSLSAMDQDDLWNLTAAIWRLNATSPGLAEGRQLFAQNCAACHGERGAGDGVFADDLLSAGRVEAPSMTSEAGMSVRSPASFTDSARMLAASPALLQGKILRGGMGTGMPSWGSILTDEQTWNLVAYLYSFQFDYP